MFQTEVVTRAAWLTVQVPADPRDTGLQRWEQKLGAVANARLCARQRGRRHPLWCVQFSVAGTQDAEKAEAWEGFRVHAQERKGLTDDLEDGADIKFPQEDMNVPDPLLWKQVPYIERILTSLQGISGPITSFWDICPSWVCSHRLQSPDTGHRMTGMLAGLKPEIFFSHTAAQQRDWWERGASVVSPTFTRCVATAGECWGVQNTHCPCGLFKPSHGFQDNSVSWEEWLFYHVLK